MPLRDRPTLFPIKICLNYITYLKRRMFHLFHHLTSITYSGITRKAHFTNRTLVPTTYKVLWMLCAFLLSNIVYTIHLSLVPASLEPKLTTFMHVYYSTCFVFVSFTFDSFSLWLCCIPNQHEWMEWMNCLYRIKYMEYSKLIFA